MQHLLCGLLVLFPAVIGILTAQTQDWTVAGNHALYLGHSAEAARDYRLALDEALRTAPAGEQRVALIHLCVSLATAYLGVGNLHDAEGALRQAEADGVSAGELPRAELLNAWATVHLREGRWNESERELSAARRLLAHGPDPSGVLPAALHNLAALETRTGAYAEALGNERDALALWTKMLNPDHPHLIKAWAALSTMQFLRREYSDAHDSIEHAISGARSTYGSQHPLVADLLEQKALIYDRLKLRKYAQQARREARGIRGGEPAPQIVRNTWNIREALPPDSAVFVESK